MGTSLRQAEMFEGVPLGTARVSLARARELVAEVDALAWTMDEALAWTMDETYYDRAVALAGRARIAGAHALARAICWGLTSGVLETRGPDAIEIARKRAANRWLRRQETGR